MGGTWETLEKSISKYSPENQEFIRRAYHVSRECHEGQKRASGEPYIAHPLAIAENIAELGLDAHTVAATLLHDTIEDCGLDPKKIKNEFGDDVLFLVEGVTKLGHVRYNKHQREMESLRKMFLAVAEDIRVVLIKLYDRLHNMETAQYLPPEKQERIAMETLELFAPLAYRLGIGELKGQLEDLAFPILYPEEYKWLVSEVQERITGRRKYLNRLIPIIKRDLAMANLPVLDIHFRAKHYYSLWRKLLKHDMDFGSIYDLLAVRVITNTVADCYVALGVLHKLWKPLPGRIKDYIALPKPNGYRSLHTTVFALEGKITEIQIRTEEMNEEAELGIAAHWMYEEAGKSSERARNAAHASLLVRQLQEWQKTFSEATDEELLESLKIDFFKDRIFVLTPKGDVIDLPDGATPVDFAYNIHTDIGNHMTGAKANEKMVSFSYPLKSGDTVEILTQKKKKPSPDWLKFAKTSHARSKIRHALLQEGFKFPRPIRLWNKPLDEVELSVRAENRVGMLRDISSLFVERKININNHRTDTDVQSFHLLTFRFRPNKEKDLEKIATAVRNIKGVREVRITHVTP